MTVRQTGEAMFSDPKAEWLLKKEALFHRNRPVLIDQLLARRDDFPQVLDCGTGIGSLIKYLAPLIRYESIVGVDLHPDLFEAGRNNLDLARVKDVSFREGNVEKLHEIFAAETFDLVMSLELLDHLLDPVAGLREMWRVLKPGGTLLCLRVAEVEIILEPPHPLDSQIFGNFYRYVFDTTSDSRCGRKLWSHAKAAGLTAIEVANTPWFLYPPLASEEQDTVRFIIEEFFYKGSTAERASRSDRIDDGRLTEWLAERRDQIDNNELTFYVNHFSLSATKPTE